MSFGEFDHDGELIHPVEDEDDDGRAEAEFRRVMEIEDYERIGLVILAILERQKL